MCGVYGIYNKSKNVLEKELDKLENRMIFRGPDDSGRFIDHNLGLGMRRLAILDIVNGTQPMSDKYNNIQLVYNGEIYNFLELRNELEIKGYVFETNSDTEVLLNMYIEYGKDCISKLNGMFGFCIYDKRLKQLWIVRDRLGIKPLYFFYSTNKFIFSSELVGISKITDAKISKSSILDYLSYSYIPAPKTIYENIHKLEVGEELIFNIETFTYRKNKYWNLDNNVNTEDDQSSEKVNEILKNSVKKQMISDVPVGVFLSGGLDSSMIATYASLVSDNKPINTFTINFEGKDSEDKRYADLVSAKIMSNHNEINVDSKSQLKELDNLMFYMDEPMSDSAIIPTYLISKLASEKGIKVILSGAGADEIFGGYPRYFPKKFASAAWVANLPKLLRIIISYLLGIYNPSYKYRFKNSARNFACSISGINYKFIKDILIDHSDFNYLLQGIDKRFIKTQSTSSHFSMKTDLTDYLPNNILALTDKATMAASIEGRVPFLDHEIVENVFSLNEGEIINKNEPKSFLKKIAKNLLPNELLFRKKEGFNAPVHKWIEDWPDEIKAEIISNMSPILSSMINKNIVKSWLEFANKRQKAATSLYALYVLNKWIRTHNNF